LNKTVIAVAGVKRGIAAEINARNNCRLTVPISLVKTSTPSDAREFWKSKTVEERLEALELTSPDRARTRRRSLRAHGIRQSTDT
jgi:hypothetical protein